MCFELVSDLKIDQQKSEVIPVGETMDVNRATSLFGCKVGKLPTSYLGFTDPLGPLKSIVVFGTQLRKGLKGN